MTQRGYRWFWVIAAVLVTLLCITQARAQTVFSVGQIDGHLSLSQRAMEHQGNQILRAERTANITWGAGSVNSGYDFNMNAQGATVGFTDRIGFRGAESDSGTSWAQGVGFQGRRANVASGGDPSSWGADFEGDGHFWAGSGEFGCDADGNCYNERNRLDLRGEQEGVSVRVDRYLPEAPGSEVPWWDGLGGCDFPPTVPE